MIGGFRTRRMEINPADADRISDADLAQIVTPEVTAHLPPHLIADACTDPQDWLNRLMAGGPVFAVETDTLLLGVLTLKQVSEQHWMLGYVLAAPAWGKGYGTELVLGLSAHLQAGGWQGRLTGGVAQGNPASVRVLEKAGFAALPPDPDAPEDVSYYALEF